MTLSDWHAGHTIIDNPKAHVGCRTHRHASRELITKHDHLIHQHISYQHLDHITSQHALQKQVRRPLFCCCKFYVAAMGFYQELFLPMQKPQR